MFVFGPHLSYEQKWGDEHCIHAIRSFCNLSVFNMMEVQNKSNEFFDFAKVKFDF